MKHLINIGAHLVAAMLVFIGISQLVSVGVVFTGDVGHALILSLIGGACLLVSTVVLVSAMLGNGFKSVGRVGEIAFGAIAAAIFYAVVAGISPTTISVHGIGGVLIGGLVTSLLIAVLAYATGNLTSLKSKDLWPQRDKVADK